MQKLTKENTVRPDLDALEAIRALQKLNRSRVLVLSRDKELMGVLTLKDMLEFFAMKADLEKA